MWLCHKSNESKRCRRNDKQCRPWSDCSCVDPDQTAPLGAVWSGSTLFAQTRLSETLEELYGSSQNWSNVTITEVKQTRSPNIILRWHSNTRSNFIWTASSEFSTYRLCEQRRFMRACASAQSRQNLRCSLIQAVSQEEPSDRKPDPWPLWMSGHAQLKFIMTECLKTQIRLTGLI